MANAEAQEVNHEIENDAAGAGIRRKIVSESGDRDIARRDSGDVRSGLTRGLDNGVARAADNRLSGVSGDKVAPANTTKSELGAIGSGASANIGQSPSANVGDPLAYDPFANVGKVLRMPQAPTLAKSQKPFHLNQLEWYKSAGKPSAPKGFYWQASGSKTEQVGKRKKKIVAGWLLIKNGKCQGCGERYRPPIVYLKGSAWATLQGESYGRQRAEITFMLGKSRAKLNDLRCPECVSGFHGQMPTAGAAS